MGLAWRPPNDAFENARGWMEAANVVQTSPKRVWTSNYNEPFGLKTETKHVNPREEAENELLDHGFRSHVPSSLGWRTFRPVSNAVTNA